MLLENLVTRRVSEENASNSSLTRRVTKRGHLLLAALEDTQSRRLAFIVLGGDPLKLFYGISSGVDGKFFFCRIHQVNVGDVRELS